jgi:AcrR family transcriptional regulator
MEQDRDLGLRERKKLATRDALADAALRLALRDGPENVRVPDIAAEADVSPRTFNNYFSSVPEAICARAAQRALRIGDMLRLRPAAEPLAEAITNAMLEDDVDSQERRPFVEMIFTSPVLRGEFYKTVVAREQAFAEAIAERVQAPEGDLNPQLLAAAYFGMTRVIGQRWMCEEGADYPAMMRTGLELLAPAADAYQASRNITKNAA